MPLLECVGLVKKHGEKLALDNVHFEVEEGEIVALVGLEGSGKTTAYRLVCGLLSPTSGRVLFHGVDVTDLMPDQQERVGMRFVPKDVTALGKMTVEDSLLAAPQSLEMKAERRRSQVDGLLRRLGLDSRAGELVENLSFGEQTRLQIATCLIARPSLVVLDEPFAALDLLTMHSIEAILSDEAKLGLSVLLTDNRGCDSVRFAERTYVLHKGRVVISGDAKTVLDDPIARREYLGDDAFRKRR